MNYNCEISKDGKNWHKTQLFSPLPINAKTKYIVTIRNLIIFSSESLRRAKTRKRKLKNEMKKLGLIMELAGYPFRIFAYRKTQKPKEEINYIDAEYEVIE